MHLIMKFINLLPPQHWNNPCIKKEKPPPTKPLPTDSITELKLNPMGKVSCLHCVDWWEYGCFESGFQQEGGEQRALSSTWKIFGFETQWLLRFLIQRWKHCLFHSLWILPLFKFLVDLIHDVSFVIYYNSFISLCYNCSGVSFGTDYGWDVQGNNRMLGVGNEDNGVKECHGQSFVRVFCIRVAMEVIHTFDQCGNKMCQYKLSKQNRDFSIDIISILSGT